MNTLKTQAKSILPTTVEATPPPAPISTIVEPKSRSWDNLAMMNDDDEGADSDGSGEWSRCLEHLKNK